LGEEKLRVAKDGFPPLVTMPMETELQKQLLLAQFAIGMMLKIGLFIRAVIELVEVIIPTMQMGI
jgi:hypothetical protein